MVQKCRLSTLVGCTVIECSFFFPARHLAGGMRPAVQCGGDGGGDLIYLGERGRGGAGPRRGGGHRDCGARTMEQKTRQCIG
eukprot:2365367-Pyramimonas_sp.AAC.1